MFTGKSQLWVGKESSKEPLVIKHGKLGNSLSVEVFNGKIIAGTELRTAVDSTIYIFIYDHLWFLEMHQVSINNGIKKFFIISCTWKASEKSLLAVWRWRWSSWYDVVFAGQQKDQNKSHNGKSTGGLPKRDLTTFSGPLGPDSGDLIQRSRANQWSMILRCEFSHWILTF